MRLPRRRLLVRRPSTMRLPRRRLLVRRPSTMRLPRRRLLVRRPPTTRRAAETRSGTVVAPTVLPLHPVGSMDSRPMSLTAP